MPALHIRARRRLPGIIPPGPAFIGMPELPDVENYGRYFHRHALDRKITGVAVSSTRVLDGLSARALDNRLAGHRFTDTCRLGKHLFAALDDGQWLEFHFGMTGRLAAFDEGDDDPRYDRLRIDFADGGHLAFVDQRLLGRVRLVDTPEAFARQRGLGPDALAVPRDVFGERLGKKKGTLKSALMDQGLVAGIGNVFADEILYQARLHPQTAVQSLDAAAAGRLHTKMRHVLEMAIKKGAGAEGFDKDIPGSWLLAHREKGGKCPCGGQIATMKVNGRTTYYCPDCQKKE